MAINLTRADEILRSGVDDGVFTHAVYALALDGDIVALDAFGQATVGTIFDLASLTKPIATATLLMQCVERGEVHLKQRVDTFFSETYGALADLADVDLFYLATHTAGLPPIPVWPQKGGSHAREELLAWVLKTPRGQLPGTGYSYSDTGYILLGEILTLATSTLLPDLFRTRIAIPAGIEDLGYLPPADRRSRIAPTSTDGEVGVVHDPRARELGGAAGHAGLFGTVESVLRYLEIVRTGGRPLLSRASIIRMSSSQIETGVGAHSIGWFCAGNDYLPAGDLFSERAFGHSGFTGTVALVDPEYRLSLVLLTNRVIHGEDDNRRFLSLRRRWANVIAAAVSSDR